MAMNKKERAEFEAALDRARVLGALRWTEPVEPDLPVPASSSAGPVRGWTYNLHVRQVWPSISTSVAHATGRAGEPPPRTTTQRGIPQYSTERLALQALRHAIATQAARAMAEIDQQLEVLA